MSKLKSWQKSGLVAAISFFILNGGLWAVSKSVGKYWYYQETIWFKALLALNYPAAEVGRIFLNRVGIPKIYDVPVPFYDAVVINLTWVILDFVWWFLLGVMGATAWFCLSKRSGSALHV